MLKADDLNVYYGKIHAIKNVSFEVKNGEIVSLIGANGAGKTTILHTISGLLRSTTGSITFEDKNISHIEPHKLVRHGLSHVPEGRHVFLQMTVLENLEMGAYSMKKVSPSALKRVYELFPRLEERKNQIADTIDFYEISQLTFEKPDMDTFKALKLAFKAGKIGGLMPTILNGANEAAVELFLNKKIGFLDIADLIERAMEEFEEEGKGEVSLEKVIDLDKRVKEYVRQSSI